MNLPPAPSTKQQQPHNPQGLYAFRKLRELRHLHETCWQPSEELARNHTEDEIEELQEQLDNRGGSKKENVFDLIKRKKKKMRIAEVMDQKANSVADLAAVLVEQEKVGVEVEAAQEIEAKQDRDREVKEMLELYTQAKGSGVEKLQRRIEKMQRELLRRKEGGEQVKEGQMSRSSMRRAIHDLERKKEKMEFAAQVINRLHAQQDSREFVKAVEEHFPGYLQYFDLKINGLKRRIADHHERSETPLGKLRGRLALEERKKRMLQSRMEAVNEAKQVVESEIEKQRRVYIQKLEGRIEKLHHRIDRGAKSAEEVEQIREVIASTDELKEAAKDKTQFEEVMHATHPLQERIQDLREELKKIYMQPEGPNKKARAEVREERERLKDLVKTFTCVLNGTCQDLESVQILAKDFETTATDVAAAEAAAENATPPVPAQISTLEADSSETQDTSPQQFAPLLGRPNIDYHALLPSFPDKEKMATSDPYQLNKHAHLRHKLLRLQKPAFSMSGVTVKWQNVLDAEYAEAWPQDVSHEPMGFTRYIAPKPEKEAALSVEEWVESRKREERVVEEEEVRSEILDGLKRRMVERLKELDPTKGQRKLRERQARKAAMAGESGAQVEASA